jgi:S-DNA-T family DNA segregation ATPase FtsK/SpoIIIE
MREREMARWSRDTALPEVADAALVEVGPEGRDDAETAPVDVERYGGPVDPPDEPVTVYATVTRWETHERAPIVPAWLRNSGQRQQTLAQMRDFAWYSVRFHTWRFVTKYAWLAAFWAVVGVFRVGGRQLRWWWVTDAWLLEQAAANRGDKDAGQDWRKTHRAAKDTRRFRGIVLAVELVAVVAVVLFVWHRAPMWVQFAVVLVAVPVLARLGRPADKPILDRVTLGTRFVKLTAEQVRNALCALGLAGIKDPASVKFPQDIHRDGPGWLARVNLPLGVEAVDVMERRGKLSSALRLPVDQVWPTAGPEHAGQLDLWVGYQPASKMGQPRWSLASPTARCSVFEPAEFGTDQRQRPVLTSLFARNFLLGGVPGSGKSYGARTLALMAALDPTAELKIAEFKGTADFGDLAHLCSTYVCGVDDQSLEDGADILRWGLAEAERRGRRIAAARARGEAPEGKVTPELAARPGSGLHPVVIILDEAHEVLVDKDVAAAAERLIKRGRALGLIVILATQVPDAKSVPPNITRCVTVRWCMAVQDQVANDMILGTGAYKRGLSAAVYRPGLDAGWGIITGLAEPTPVRSHFPDQDTTAEIIARATELRGGTVVGDQADAQQRRDILTDVLHVMSERADHWETLAERLAALDPAYTGITAEVVSARLRAAGITSIDVKVDGIVRKGARREAITEAINRRALPGSGGGSG